MEDTPKHRSHKKLFRSRSLRSVGQFMQRLLRTLSHLGEGDRGTPEPEDDEGGFRHKDHPGVPQEETGRVQGGDSNNNRCQELPPGKTEMGVPPGKAEVPGVLGLKNHGNTCFMNAVIQCLSNTDLLAEYLGTERYRAHGEEVSAPGTRGEVSAPGTRGEVSAPGTRGEVTERLASLVRALWTRQYTPQISAEFKSAVARHGSQFRGNSQHDALEFLMWLLDRVHEDLNSSPAGAATKRPACERSGPDSSPGDGGHSFVQEHFQAQYRSSLTCPHCHKQSDTFDPFLCVSLPIPLRQTRALNVTLVFQSQQHRFLRVGLAVPLLGSVAALRQMAADQGNIPPDQVILAELYPSGFQRSFSDDEDVNSIAEGDPVYAFHVPLPRTPSSGFPRSLPSSPRSSHTNSSRLPGGGSASSEVLASKLLLLLCNVDGAGQQALRFGPPLVLREDRTVSWDQLQQNILAKTRYLMQSDAHLPSIGADVIFHVRVAGAPASSCYLSETDARPLQHPAVDRALQLCGSGGPPHVKLAVEWDSKTKERLFGSIQEEVVRDDESVRAQQLDHQQQSCTLDECFQLYTKEEQLAPDDAWRCPHCKVLQQGTVKLSLWTLPDILIIHLKRFRQVGGRRNKLSTLVKFPLTRMDMAPHVVKRGHGSRGPAGQWSTWRTAQCQMDGGQMDVMYDLYAVCNHHGSLQGGHYTAYCRNSMDARWYGYDDSNVEVVQEEEVCTRGAYLLFYQKRNAIPTWSASSSVRGSTSSSISDHWVLRLNGSKSVVSRATASCSPLPQIPDSEVFLDEETLDQGCGTRSFVRGVKGRSASMKLSSASRLKLSLSKAMPLRWSFGARDKARPQSEELGEYLESGRRPKFTNDPIVPLMTPEKSGPRPKVNQATTNGANSATGHSRALTASSRMEREKVSTTKGDGPSPQRTSGGAVPSSSSSAVVSTTKGEGPSPQRTSGGAVPSSSSSAAVSTTKGDGPSPQRTSGGAVPSSSSADKAKANPGKSGRPRTSESGHPEGKSGVMRREPRRPSSSENVHNGSARVTSGAPSDGRTTMPRHHREDPGRGQTEIRRAQSSAHVQSKVEWTMKHSTSLYRNGSAPRGSPAERSSSGPLPRYQTSSLGRKKNVPESSF